MSLTDNLQLRPIMAIQALQEAGVALVARVEDGPMGEKVKIEATWRAPVGYGIGQTGTIPVIVVEEGPSIEEAAVQVLRKVQRLAGLDADALASRAAGSPAKAF